MRTAKANATLSDAKSLKLLSTLHANCLCLVEPRGLPKGERLQYRSESNVRRGGEGQ